jgi:hypothetical protein
MLLDNGRAMHSCLDSEPTLADHLLAPTDDSLSARLGHIDLGDPSTGTQNLDAEPREVPEDRYGEQQPYDPDDVGESYKATPI